MNKRTEKSIEIGGRKLTLSTGYLAQQASGAVLATYGETVVLATVVTKPLPSEIGYFPLTVEYQEKLYAGGRIKGSRWVKREGRPTDDEILAGRLIDRSIRPLFPKSYSKNEVQIIVTVLSVDLENSPDIVAAIATSAAVSISKIPWYGPVGVIRVGYKDEEFIVNPKDTEIDSTELDLVVSSTKDSIIMVEAGAKQLPEDLVLKALELAQKEAKKIIDLIDDFSKEIKPKKDELKSSKVTVELQKKVKDLTADGIKKLIVEISKKESFSSDYEEVKSSVISNFEDEEKIEVANIFDELFHQSVRKMILAGKRPDGRKTDEIRELSCEVSVLPRTHGSAIFQRGQTQALSIVTLGAPSLEQLIESASGEETKRYIHHYSMPPYSTGETGRIGYPSRREIGHGALAERSLFPVIPSEEKFPYTIRVVTEVLSSNGSTSMASVCGSTLSLMDAGVPIETPIAGIAMGLVVESEKDFVVLTDIIGIEDGNGDMDFKVAGSDKGITAMQLDVKTLKLGLPLLNTALIQAKKARLAILEVMKKTLEKSRNVVSKYAPKIKIIKIDPSKIGELIGPGGKVIRKISAETGVQVDVNDEGVVYISASSEEELAKGVERVEAITKEPIAGEIYEGLVKRIQPFGAFVEIWPGKEGLVHVSDMREDFVKDPSEILKLGDKIQVRVKGIDELGRLNLSMMLDPSFDSRKEERRKEGNNRPIRHFEKRDNRGEKKVRGGPHFPTSRFFAGNKKKYSA